MEQQLRRLLRKIAIVFQNLHFSLHNESIVSNLRMNFAPLDRWILNRWIVYHEIAQPLHLLYIMLSTSDFMLI